jgi:hypothetical protein
MGAKFKFHYNYWSIGLYVFNDFSGGCRIPVQWNLDLRKPDLRKYLDLRKIVATTDFLVHKLFDLRKIF